MATYDKRNLYTQDIPSFEDVPQKKTVFEIPTVRGGAPEFAQPSRQAVTAMIGRYPTRPEIPLETRLAPTAQPRGTARQPAAQLSDVSQPTQELLPNYLRNEQTGAVQRFKSQPTALTGEYIPAMREPTAQQSPAREALSEYEDILSTFGGTGPNSALAADILTRRVLGKAAGIRQERGATERAATSEAGALERAKLGERGAMARATAGREPTEESAARAALLRGQLGDMQEKQMLMRAMTDKSLTDEDRATAEKRYAMKFGSKERQDRESEEVARLVSTGILTEKEGRIRLGLPVEGMADGGVVRGFANGGAITEPVTQTQQVNPAIAQYGQYLTAAAQSGVAPVPFNQYMNLLQSTRSAMQTTPTQFADGGDVSALGRPLEGPGTGRSDSIPAVIDGGQPAALSDGEFVIPAHVVRAKGTEFFEKLLAQYAEGAKDNG